jgi:hypothetical protein
MKRILVVLGATMVLAVGIVAAAGVGAQDGTADPEPQNPVDAYISKLAENLGIPEADLRERMALTRDNLLADAVEEGRLSQESADQIRQRMEESGSLLPGFPRPHDGFRAFGHGNVVQAAADVLGMEMSDLVQQLRGGENSLADIAEGRGVDLESFKAGLLDAARGDLDRKVADGDLTQEQADIHFERLSDNIDDIVNHVRGAGPPPGGPHPRQMHGSTP